MQGEVTAHGGRGPAARIGLWAGVLLFVLVLLLPAPAGLSREGWVVVALLGLMATWWVTEAIPIPITSLLPLIVLPVFAVSDLQTAANPYAHRVNVLLLGGFILARAVERWGLHERLSLLVVLRFGTSPRGLSLGFLVASALLSGWISNAATTLMLLPVALSVAAALGARRGAGDGLAVLLCLSVAFGASIGGLATPIGTPTNLIVIGALEGAGDTRLSFARWMMVGVPAVAVLLPAAWLVLTRMAGAGAAPLSGDPRAVLRERLIALGAWTRPERRTLAVFAAVAFVWVFRRAFITDITVFGAQPFAGLTDHVVAVMGAVALFLIPSGSVREPGTRLLDWEHASRIPWDVLLLFGGGLSLALAIQSTGLGAWLAGEMAGLAALPRMWLVLCLVVFVIFATELTSNSATAAALMPVIIAVAAATQTDAAVLAIPVALAASCAFMFPMATAPNAIAYGSGEISIARMARIGVVLNGVAIILITALASLLTPLVL